MITVLLYKYCILLGVVSAFFEFFHNFIVSLFTA